MNQAKDKPTRRPKISAAISRALFVEAGGRCAACGEAVALERAHIIPWHRVREHTLDNLVLFCALCHRRSHKEGWSDALMEDFKRRPYAIRTKDHPLPEKNISKIEITIDVDWNTFDKNHERLMKQNIASVLGIDVSAVSIVAKTRGSVKLVIKLPEKAAGRLLDAFDTEADEGDLLNALRELKVISATIPPEAEFEPRRCVLTRRLDVSNVSRDATAAQITELFAQYGKVQDCKRLGPFAILAGSMKEPQTWEVELDTVDNANAALTGLHMKEFLDRSLIINPSYGLRRNVGRHGVRKGPRISPFQKPSSSRKDKAPEKGDKSDSAARSRHKSNDKKTGDNHSS